MDNFVSNAARPPPLSLSYPHANLEHPLRKTGGQKLTIPHGTLVGLLDPALVKPGVLRALLDCIRVAGIAGVLAGTGEDTTFDRQVKIDGRNRISKDTTPKTLDSIAVDLIMNLVDCANASSDEILTRMGFRTEFCADKLGFIDRLVNLQLVVRRALEIRADTGKTALFGWTPQNYNGYDWDSHLSATNAEAPGTATPQPVSLKDQLAALEAAKETEHGSATADTLKENLSAIMAAMKEQQHAIAAQGAQIKQLAASASDSSDERRTKKARVDQLGNGLTDITPAHASLYSPSLIFQPGPRTTAEQPDYAATLKQPEVDPADSVNGNVIAEVTSKFLKGDRITVEYVWSLACTNDQAERTELFQNGDRFEVTTVTTSSRKIRDFYELTVVMNCVIDSIGAVDRDCAFKLRRVFVQTMNEAHRFFKQDLPSTVAYFNKHFNQWHLRLRTAENSKLTFVRDWANAMSDDLRHVRDTASSKQQDVNQLKQLNAELRKQISAKGKASGPYSGTATPKVFTSIPVSMREEDCTNWAAGKPCAIVDAEGQCVFKHVGEKGSKPTAATDRFKNRA